LGQERLDTPLLTIHFNQHVRRKCFKLKSLICIRGYSVNEKGAGTHPKNSKNENTKLKKLKKKKKKKTASN